MRIVSINDHLWAVGLHWMTSPMRRLSGAELRKRAGEMGAGYDTVAFRSRQYAFGVSGGQDVERVRSLAAFLVMPSVLGIFPLRDTAGEPCWWVCGRRDALNVGMGDQVFESRDEAVLHLESLRELLDVQPEAIVECETEEDSLRWLAPLLRVSLQARLFQSGMLGSLTAISRRKKRLLIMAAVAAVAALGVWGVVDMFESRERAATMEASRLARLNKTQRRADLRDHPENYFKQAWMTAPLADAVGGRCLAAVKEVPLYSNGWKLEYVTCAGGLLSTGWLHQPGADYVHLPASATLKDDRHAVSSRMLPSLEPGTRQGQEYPRLLTRDYAFRHMHQLRQSTGIRLGWTFVAPEKRRIDETTIVAPWSKGNWQLQSVPDSLIRDLELMRSLSALPGLVLEEISFKQNAWTIKGVIYAE
jgi:hypothetical protein